MCVYYYIWLDVCYVSMCVYVFLKKLKIQTTTKNYNSNLIHVCYKVDNPLWWMNEWIDVQTSTVESHWKLFISFLSTYVICLCGCFVFIDVLNYIDMRFIFISISSLYILQVKTQRKRHRNCAIFRMRHRMFDYYLVNVDRKTSSTYQINISINGFNIPFHSFFDGCLESAKIKPIAYIQSSYKTCKKPNFIHAAKIMRTQNKYNRTMNEMKMNSAHKNPIVNKRRERERKKNHHKPNEKLFFSFSDEQREKSQSTDQIIRSHAPYNKSLLYFIWNMNKIWMNW